MRRRAAERRSRRIKRRLETLLKVGKVLKARTLFIREYWGEAKECLRRSPEDPEYDAADDGWYYRYFNKWRVSVGGIHCCRGDFSGDLSGLRLKGGPIRYFPQTFKMSGDKCVNYDCTPTGLWITRKGPLQGFEYLPGPAEDTASLPVVVVICPPDRIKITVCDAEVEVLVPGHAYLLKRQGDSIKVKFTSDDVDSQLEVCYGTPEFKGWTPIETRWVDV